jgi:hypothetical protein
MRQGILVRNKPRTHRCCMPTRCLQHGACAGLGWGVQGCAAQQVGTHRVRGAPLRVVPIRDKEVFCLRDDAHMPHLDLNVALTRRDLQGPEQGMTGPQDRVSGAGQAGEPHIRQVLVQDGRPAC